MRVIVEYVSPPIPDRSFDYVAYEDGYEPGAPQGYGPTAAAARADLLDCISTLTSVTSEDLYCMGMESETAYRLMPQLCAALGIDYPPQLSRRELSEAAQAFPDPFTESPQMRQSAPDSRR